jgi:hypothetical protein
MDAENLNNQFDNFLKDFDDKYEDETWNKISAKFRSFWNDKIINAEYGELNDSELDDYIRYLDSNAKGNTKESFSTAKAMISQGMWRKMFNDIHATKELREAMDQLFNEKEDTKKIELINRIYDINEGKKNSLTGKVGNAINSMLFVTNPKDQVSAISLNHRKKIIEYFNFQNGPDFENDDQGTKMVKSNRAIIDGFINLGLNKTIRTICNFLYSTDIKDLWVSEQAEGGGGIDQPTGRHGVEPESDESIALFYMEKHLEDFLIENWERTELGLKYELIEEDGVIVSQQYKTDIGLIDILAKEKNTGDYVVIELKKNQTSDHTVGQISRYMGWVSDKLGKDHNIKGIIIAAKYDERLYYALKVVKNVEVYLYRVDFKLMEFSQ